MGLHRWRRNRPHRSWIYDTEFYHFGAMFEKKDKLEVEMEANRSTDTLRRRLPTSGRQTLVNSMKQSLAAVRNSTSDNFKLRCGKPPTIYRVPQRIRQVNPDAYEPQILSIGPYHHGKERLQDMEKHKWLYLDSILSRNSSHPLEDYLEAIEESENQVRSCYSDDVGDKDEFVKMMVLDGCFIVELFLKLKEEEPFLKLKEEELSLEIKEKQSEVDPIFTTIWMLHVIGYDMLLLENQIPFFVLQHIFNMASPVDEPFPYSLAYLALDFFEHIMPRNKKIQTMDSIHHLLHLFHSHLIPTPTPSKIKSNPLSSPTVESVSNKRKNLQLLYSSKGFLPSSNEDDLSSLPRRAIKMIPCAADLQLAGVKFTKKVDFTSILDVKFRNGVLEIPQLLINDSTNTLFRNLVAFEQCYPIVRIRFTTYLSFMDCLVNTSKDVALLHRNGIINHLLGSDEEVTQLFNKLGYGIFDLEVNYLSTVYKNVEEHCNTEWNMLWASLRRDYFTNPWAGLSSIAAVILLVVTITQTFFAVFSYFRPPS